MKKATLTIYVSLLVAQANQPSVLSIFRLIPQATRKGVSYVTCEWYVADS